MIEDILFSAGEGGSLLAYPILFAALLGGALGLPIPEDLPLIAAGVLAHRGEVKLIPVFIVCYVAVILGDIIIFSVGRHFGPALLQHRWICRSLDKQRVENVRMRLERRSLIVIFTARHLFYLRTVTFLACGMVKMNFTKFLFADAISALISAPLMIGLGYLFSENFEVILEAVREGHFYVILFSIFLVLIAGSYLWRRSLEKTARNSSEAAKEDKIGYTSEVGVGCTDQSSFAKTDVPPHESVQGPSGAKPERIGARQSKTTIIDTTDYNKLRNTSSSGTNGHHHLNGAASAVNSGRDS